MTSIALSLTSPQLFVANFEKIKQDMIGEIRKEKTYTVYSQPVQAEDIVEAASIILADMKRYFSKEENFQAKSIVVIGKNFTPKIYNYHYIALWQIFAKFHMPMEWAGEDVPPNVFPSNLLSRENRLNIMIYQMRETTPRLKITLEASL